MTEDNQDEPDSSSSLKPTRRQVIGTLAGTGVLASMAAGQTGGGAGGTVLGIGGGDMADAAQEFRIKYYKDTMANRPAAGVVGRVYEVWDPSDSANHGKVFHDTGTAWELVDRQVGTLTTEGLGITDGDGPTWVYRDWDTGELTAENFASIQAAVDNAPAADTTRGEAIGYLYVPSKGSQYNTSDHYYNEVVDAALFPPGGRVFGSGIHTRIASEGTDPTFTISKDDQELAWFWIDNEGAGPAIQMGGECYVHHVNVDECGTFGIDTGSRAVQVGPGIEIKQGPAAAIRARARKTYITGCYIVQEFDGDVINQGIRVDGTGDKTAISDVWIFATATDNFDVGIKTESGAGAVYAANVFMGESQEDSLTSSSGGGVRALRLESDQFYGANIIEDGTFTGEGVLINTDATDIQIQGHFPSGVNFNVDQTTVGAVRISGHVGAIEEGTAGNKNGQIVNGNSWNAGDPNSTGIWNGNAALASRLGVVVWDTSTTPNIPYVAGPDGSWYQVPNGNQAFTLSNVTTDRNLDADSTTTAELADVLATLIQDLGMT